MKIVQKDLKKGIIKVMAQNQDDLWLLSQIILPKAFVSSKTTRKVKLSETKVEKKVYYVKIKSEKVNYENDLLRITGNVESEHDDIPKGSSHSLSIGINDEVKIEQNWLGFQIEKINDATKDKSNILMIVLDREDVYFAQLTNSGYKQLSNFEGNVQKKAEGMKGDGNFYADIGKKLVEYDERLKLDRIILASPAFFKEDFLKQFKDEAIKKKIILATCSSVSENAFSELLKRDEVKHALQQERIKDELEIVEKLFVEISKEGKSTYGPDHVKEKVDSGSASILLVSTAFIEKYKEEDKFEELEEIMKLVEQMKGKVVIVSSSNDAGKRLDGISGIAALLRY